MASASIDPGSTPEQPHNSDTPLRRARGDRCIPCIASRKRCNGEKPTCSNCNKRPHRGTRLMCEYPDGPTTRSEVLAQMSASGRAYRAAVHKDAEKGGEGEGEDDSDETIASPIKSVSENLHHHSSTAVPVMASYSVAANLRDEYKDEWGNVLVKHHHELPWPYTKNKASTNPRGDPVIVPNDIFQNPRSNSTFRSGQASIAPPHPALSDPNPSQNIAALRGQDPELVASITTRINNIPFINTQGDSMIGYVQMDRGSGMTADGLFSNDCSQEEINFYRPELLDIDDAAWKGYLLRRKYQDLNLSWNDKRLNTKNWNVYGDKE